MIRRVRKERKENKECVVTYCAITATAFLCFQSLPVFLLPNPISSRQIEIQPQNNSLRKAKKKFAKKRLNSIFIIKTLLFFG